MATVKNGLGRAHRYVSVASGNISIVDLRAKAGDAFPNAFVIYLNGGTATYQPCDSDGTVVPGSSSANAVSGALVPAEWPFYAIAASTAACVVAAVQAQSVELQTSDIQIGAVEIKNGASDTRAVVATTSSLAASDAGLPVASYPIASEIHMGEVGGKLIQNSDTFTSASAGDYAANDVVAADTNDTGTTPLRGITVGRVVGGGGYLVGARISTNNASWAAGLRMDLYTVQAPTTALVGDNVASAQKYANAAQFVGSVEFATMSTTTGSDFRRAVRDDLRIPFKCDAADTKLYYRLVTLAAETNESAGQAWRLTLQAEAY